MQGTCVWFLGWKDLLEKEVAPTPAFSPGKSRGQRSLMGNGAYSCRRVGLN